MRCFAHHQARAEAIAETKAARRAEAAGSVPMPDSGHSSFADAKRKSLEATLAAKKAGKTWRGHMEQASGVSHLASWLALAPGPVCL